MAAKGGAVVVSVDYRMAPEYRFPYAINDCFDTLLWVSVAIPRVYHVVYADQLQCKKNASELGIDPEKIVVAGGSAGGNIVGSLDI